MKNADMPAMPGTVWDYDSAGNTVQAMGGGLSKREHFAAMAMQGLLPVQGYDREFEYCAAQSVLMADALLAELERTGGES